MWRGIYFACVLKQFFFENSSHSFLKASCINFRFTNFQNDANLYLILDIFSIVSIVILA